MLGTKGGEAEGQSVAKQGQKGKAGKTTRGEVLSNDLLLSGLGYSKADKSKANKNKVEKQNVLRFLKDPKSELSQLMNRKRLRDSSKPERKSKEAATPAAEQAEKREVAQERLREDRVQEGHIQGQEQAEPKELREQVEAKDLHHPQQDKRDKEEDGKGAGAWVLEDGEDEDEERRKGGAAQVFSDAERCNGHIEDGSRCLRKAKEGTPFCSVHRH